MQQHVVATKKRPGYSGTTNTLKPLSYIVSGQLATGMKLNPHLLEDFGISRSESYEVRIAWRYLGWVDQEDIITETCEQLAHSSDDDFRDLLEKVLKDAYFDAFLFLGDPTHATQQEIKDAFRKSGYEPASMQSKMIALFRGLCRRAGLIIDEIEVAEASSERCQESSPDTPLQETSALDTLDLVEGNSLMVEPPSLPQMNGSVSTRGYAKIEELNEFLARLLQLPKGPGWTETEENHVWLRQALRVTNELIAQALNSHGGRK